MKKISKTEKFYLWTIVAVNLAATLQHFLYEWIPCNFIATFAPVNESVWEHLKLTFYPTLTAFFVGWFVLRNEGDFKKNDFVASCLPAVTAEVLTIAAGYYLLHSGFGIGIDVMWVDIALMVVATVIGQIIALHVYKRAHCVRACMIGSAVIIVLMIAMFVTLSFVPPRLPIFIEP